jgi:hypothetical protein
MREMSNSNRILVRKPEEKRLRGRPRNRWENKLKWRSVRM